MGLSEVVLKGSTGALGKNSTGIITHLVSLSMNVKQREAECGQILMSSCVFSGWRTLTLQDLPTIRDVTRQESEPAWALMVAGPECCFWAVSDLEQVTTDTQQLMCQHTDLQTSELMQKT